MRHDSGVKGRLGPARLLTKLGEHKRRPVLQPTQLSRRIEHRREGVHGVGIGRAQKKRKNPGVGVDFKRIKHKVGKKLKKAANETSVTFKSATINLPSQGVQQDKDGVAVNFQNLSLQAG